MTRSTPPTPPGPPGPPTSEPADEDLLRRLVPQVLGALVRRYGHFDAAEDAVQEALLAAARQWPEEGRPRNPRGWLIRVASRRLTDQLRSEDARRRREETAAALTPRDEFVAPPPGEGRAPAEDDTLALLFLCCSADLPAAGRIALTLRAVGGLTTAEIARALLVPEATMAQRISRAKRRIKTSPSPFRTAKQEQEGEREREGAARLADVLHVLYLIFNEGYTASSGRELQRADLATEAIRLTRAVHALLPDDGEVAGLLALMLLTDARRAARTGPDGSLIPLAEQDRTLWDRAAVTEGVALVSDALTRTPLGPYQLRAAIAAVHDEAASDEDTDWVEILALYEVLIRLVPGPVERLGHAVAVAMVHGPRRALELLAALDDDDHLAGHHRLEAVRAHLLERAGDRAAARAAYTKAAGLTLSAPERRYLRSRAARIAE
ncbi:sigma-70 family RNA polymerase sigma factor [Streptomyces yangpuensis]|uniref:Sigma-70 family RNA polymerase sigma factor n=1 Tax=Streptomyces yangpuensis TaxID=1648182 RepID=A0ABY5Q572_9ACTN|nr:MULTISPECIES: sigma-70 family RNA polymerase sigma factor [Streptomyces]MBZ9600028.1 sigma-70 family RNA polymerase sigma factor [Streptomyces erythrochromogenes]UUY51586.1 sigma-70 family RNA polymerase sigma factor [Streptomyces yangpuensis]